MKGFDFERSSVPWEEEDAHMRWLFKAENKTTSSRKRRMALEKQNT